MFTFDYMSSVYENASSSKMIDHKKLRNLTITDASL